VATLSDRDGRFTLEWDGPTTATLDVRASGFVPFARALSVSASPPTVEVVLRRAGFNEEVTVTASRRAERLGDSPASVAVLSREELLASASVALDEVLRHVPGFTLFRRTGSRAANPTTQGASLRGVGGSGAGRAVVLDDGIPLNDAFGGWVYWGRVPRAAIERAEVLRGGASSLYGSGALTGVVQVFRRAGHEALAEGEASYGSQGTHDVSLFARGGRGHWVSRLAAESFGTEGYAAVDAREAGPVDTPVDSRHLSLDLTVERAPAGAPRVFARGALYSEDRRNGTPLQRNDTELRTLALGVDGPLGGGEAVARAHLGHQRFDQSFTAIAEDRRSERLTREQTVPSDWGGIAAHWTRPLGESHVLLAGGEAIEVRGRSDETVFAAGGLSQAVGGGRQRSLGLFVQETALVGSRLSLSTGIRLDRWVSFDGRSGPPGAPALPDRAETALSPRVSALYRASSRVSVTSSAYGAFRAPTLNELYRAFRVGNVVTLANAGLGAERLWGAEAGVLAAPSNVVSARATLFWMEVDDTVANVTLTVTPSLVTRQRRNLGGIRSRGAEVEAEARPAAGLAVSAAWLLAGAHVLSFPEDPTLEGLRIPQVPRHQASLRLRFETARGGAAAQGRWSSRQFEDDQNRLQLGPAWSLDARAWVTLRAGVEGFVAAENLLDSRWEVGRTPARTLGPPRSVRAGVRLRFAPSPHRY